MKKKIAILLMCLISLASVLSGCTLFERNLAKYYTKTVISIEYPNGDNIDITKKELITAFNNYGSTLVSQGSTMEDALNQTMTALINQKVLIKDSEDKITLSNLDRNNLWEESVDAIKTNLETFAKEVREKWEIAEPDTKEENESTKVVYTPYEKTVEVVYENGNYVIKLIEQQEDENIPLICDKTTTSEICDNIYDVIMSMTKAEDSATDNEKLDAKVYSEALKKYIRTLVINEDGQKLSTDNESVFKREIKRIYENKLDALKITKMQEYINGTSNLSSITVKEVLNKYKSLILESYTKYKVAPSQFDTDVLNSFSTVNYIPNDEYFFVSHILLKFTDEQKNEYTSLETQLKKGLISPAYYEEKILALQNQVTAFARDAEGDFGTEKKNANEILTEVKTTLNDCSSDEQRAEAFRNLLYKYNQDEGALNSEYLYVVGTENSGMVESFTEASRNLHNDGEGNFGDVSELVVSEFGVHIVFYAGSVKNLFEVHSVDALSFDEKDIITLTQTLLNPLNNKSVFDKVYELLSTQATSTNEAMYLNVIKSDLKITKYTKAYKDLLG